MKQVLVVRKDLNMRKGKIAAQCAHASLKVFLDRSKTNSKSLTIELTEDMIEWMNNGRYSKICVSVDSEEDLIDIYNKARAANIPCSLITDAGLTEFNGVPTKTVVAIGPAKSEEIDKITGQLKLL